MFLEDFLGNRRPVFFLGDRVAVDAAAAGGFGGSAHAGYTSFRATAQRPTCSATYDCRHSWRIRIECTP